MPNTLEQPKVEKDLKVLADQLDKMQAEKNSGRGVSCVRSVVTYLKMGDLESARAVCHNEHDKIINYPDIKEFVIKNLFEKGEDHPWTFLEKLQSGEFFKD